MANLSWDKMIDWAVDHLYCREPIAVDAERVTMLFEKYQQNTANV